MGALYSGYSWNALGAPLTFSIASLAALAAAVIIATRMQEDTRSLLNNQGVAR
jgi:PPP family 3-phenylpropionic acid transporter